MLKAAGSIFECRIIQLPRSWIFMTSKAGDKKKSEPTQATSQRFQASGKCYRQFDFISCSQATIRVNIQKQKRLLLIFTEILQNIPPPSPPTPSFVKILFVGSMGVNNVADFKACFKLFLRSRFLENGVLNLKRDVRKCHQI